MQNPFSFKRFFNFKHVVLAVFFLAFSLLFFYLKYQAPQIVQSLYEGERIDLLNQLTFQTETRSPLYYIGRSQETFFGPLTQLISGALLLVFIFSFLSKMKPWTFGLTVFAYLIITKFDVLFFPPYGDAIGGPFVEGIWLERHAFDYFKLFRLDGYAWGGPKVYMFSIYPTYLAVLLRLIPSTKIFLFVNHAIVFAMAATIVAMSKQIFEKVFSKDVAILAALILLNLPLFQSQTEAINMEMPCVFFVVLSAHAFMNKRIHWAGILAVLAVLVKGTAIFACGAFVLIGIFRFFAKTDQQFNWRLIVWSVILILIACLKVLSKFLSNDQHVSQGMVALGVGWPSLYNSFIFYLYLTSFLIFLCYVLAYQVQKRKNLNSQWKTLLPGLSEAWLMYVFCGMWFLLFLNFYAVSPRYRVLAYPFLIFCIFYAGALLIRNLTAQKILLTITLSVALISSYGLFYKPMIENDHVILERSLEYRNDLALNQMIVKRLEDRYADFKIGAPFVIAQLLAMPQMGYVSKKLDVMIYGFNCNYGDIGNFPGLKELNLKKTIYVGVKVVKLNEDLSYPIAPHDKIIEELQYGNKKAWLFMGGVAIESVLRATRMMKMREVLETGP